MREISIGDVSLNVFEQGQGQPLLFVHGFPLDHTMWSEQLDSFAKDYRVIAPDLRGFGGSSVTPGVVTMEQMADDLSRLLDQLSISQRVLFCGLSMGGYIAWQFWQRHRDRLSALILCDTRAVADPEEVARGRLQLAEKVLSHGSSVAAESMLPRLFAKATAELRPELVETTKQVMLKTHPQAVAATLRGMAQRRDFTAQLGEIATRTLVICGEHDEISRAEEMHGIAEAMPNAQFQKIPQAGHLAPLENPVAVNAAIRTFLAS